MFCHRCGQRNPSGVNFCSSCGDAMPGKPTDATIILGDGEVHPERKGDASGVELHGTVNPVDALVVQEGPNAGTRYDLTTLVTTAGRTIEADIFLDDVTVSRRHAEFVRNDNDRVVLRDVGSLNGTYCNRQRVDEVELETGDIVQIGKFKLIFIGASETR